LEKAIQLKHPTGKRAVTMEQKKYDAMRSPLLACLKAKGESTHKEMLQAITETFKVNNTEFEGSVEWHMEWMKLDLEARNEIKRTNTSPPITFALV
jgi:hypothetical protein